MEHGIDVALWFAKDVKGQLWVSAAFPDMLNETFGEPTLVKSIKDAKSRLAKGYNVILVGICDPNMLGI